MRPTNEYGAVAVLETPQELEILGRYLDSTAYQRTQPGFHQLMETGTLPGRESDALNPVGQAFHYQIDELDRKEFRIQDNEKEIAMAAAYRVLRSVNPVKQVRDRVSGRHQAAKDIVHVLSSV